jgi:hypothetical protein
MEENDRQLALQLNEKEYSETGQLIECGCCCCEYPFEQVQVNIKSFNTVSLHHIVNE